MPTISFHASPAIAKQIRAASKKRGVPISNFVREATEIAVNREAASFADWAIKFSGVVKSGRSDLSQREGFGS
jgi:hypothetical protein